MTGEIVSNRNLDVVDGSNAGIDELYLVGWNAIFAPKGTPAAIVAKLNAAALKAMATPSIEQRVRELGATVPPPDHRTPQFLQTLVVSEIKTWGDAAKSAGITPE